jgi:predicted DNA-binding ribbon-helix-helix protein
MTTKIKKAAKQDLNKTALINNLYSNYLNTNIKNMSSECQGCVLDIGA